MTDAVPAPATDTARIDRTNFLLNTVEGALFIASGAFINPQTVLPALVSRLGGSNVVVGALGVIVYVGLFLPQILAARHFETLPWKRNLVLRMGAAHRFLVLLMGLVLLIFGANAPAVALWGFMLLFTAMQVMMGVNTPGWYEMFAKLTSRKKRGRLAGFRNSLGGAAAFVCGLVLTWLLGNEPFPLGFALAFFAAFLLQMSSLVTQLWLVETVPSVTTGHPPVVDFLRQLPAILRENAPFKRFVVSCCILTLATMPMGFYTVYALQHFGADESVVGAFTLTMVAIQVVSALVNGFIADRYGNKVALIIAGAALLLASLTALLAPSVGWFTLVYLSLGVNLGTEVMSRYNMSVEYGPSRQRSTYVGLMNTLVAPWYLSGMVGGILSEWLGLRALFGIGVLISAAGLYILWRRVADPRITPAPQARPG